MLVIFCVTYDSDDQMFVVHRKPENKPNMEFQMHESGLHYYDPRNNEFTFILILSPGTRKVSHRGRSRVQKSLKIYAQCLPTHPGRISSGWFKATKSRTVL
jgi:hypothetical protein